MAEAIATLLVAWVPEQAAPITPARRFLCWSPLAVILIVQAILSARLIPLAIAGPDEARYIDAGHQLIYELWHGGGSPYYETYFSGAPDIYSPIAAMADHVGGLAAVRLVSLACMLMVTFLLYATTNRLFGYWAGICAAGLFAGLGLTHDLSAYANYDALALMFLAAAAYCATRTGKREKHANKWLLAIPLVLLAANASKYMTVVFDPVIVGLAALQLGGSGRWRIVKRFLVLGGAMLALLLLAATLAGSGYVKGIMFTTLARKGGTQVVIAAVATPARTILAESAQWIGVIVILGIMALIGATVSRHDRARLGLLMLLVAAGFLVTLEALHLHSDESMRQHDDFGAWFTCIAAGYAISAVPQYARLRGPKIAAAGFGAFFVGVTGFHYTTIDRSTYEGGLGQALPFYSRVEPYLSVPGLRILVGGFANFQMVYVDHTNVPWFDLFDDVYIKYPVPGRGGDWHGQASGLTCFKQNPRCMYLEGPAGYRAAIHAHAFAFISLYGDHHGSAEDKAIELATAHTRGYILLTHTGKAPTWIYAPDYRHLPATAHKTKAAAQPATAHHEPGAQTVLRTLAVTLAAVLLLVGAVAWHRRRGCLETHLGSRMATRVPARGTAMPVGHRVAGRGSRLTRSAGDARGPRPPSHEKALRARAVLPLASPRLVAVVGCTVGAGQTVTTLMLADRLASLRGEPVAALDLNPGPTSLRELAQIPATTASTVLLNRSPSAHTAHLGHAGRPARPGGPRRGSRGRGHLDVICKDSAAMADGTLTGPQHSRLIDILASRYLLTLADPGASELAKILAAADQLVLVVSANADAGEAVSVTGEWLRAHGHSALAAHSIAVINGVSQRSMRHAEQAELVLRRRCRATVRVPWDDHLAGPATGLGIRDSLLAPPGPSRLNLLAPAVLQAYTALAAALVSALVVGPA